MTTVAISPKNIMLSHNVTRASICFYRLSTKMVKFNFERTIPLKIKPPQYNFLNKTHQISDNCIYKHRKVFQSILRGINVASERPKWEQSQKNHGKVRREIFTTVFEGAVSILYSLGVSGTHSHLLSSWLQVLGGTERAVLTSVKALHQDKEKEAARGERLLPDYL